MIPLFTSGGLENKADIPCHTIVLADWLHMLFYRFFGNKFWFLIALCCSGGRESMSLQVLQLGALRIQKSQVMVHGSDPSRGLDTTTCHEAGIHIFGSH